jgi:hypothetical protein
VEQRAESSALFADKTDLMPPRLVVVPCMKARIITLFSTAMTLAVVLAPIAEAGKLVPQAENTASTPVREAAGLPCSFRMRLAKTAGAEQPLSNKTGRLETSCHCCAARCAVLSR